MARRQVDIRKVFLPSDAIAILVVIIGLFIALFLDEMAVRLIGVCIAVLGGVALFMMVSPRLTDMSMSRPPRPTDAPSFVSETQRDALKKRQVFDSIAYRATFGAEGSTDEPSIDERQQELFPGMIDEAEQRKDGAKSSGSTLGAAAERHEGVFDNGPIEVGDGVSSVRILGTKKGRSQLKPEPDLAIRNREARRTAELRSQPMEPVRADVSEEVQLSDEVIIRPKAVTAEEPPTQRPIETPSIVLEETPVVAEPIEINESSVPRITIVEDHTEGAEPPKTHKRRRSEISVSAFMQDADDEMEQSEEPRKEFDYLLNRVLMVIRSAIPARTAAFFWVNRDKEQLVLEAKITDAPDDFVKQRKVKIGHDVVSQIALDGRPEILTEISPNAELDLLPYYRYKAGTVSFVGVPVYFKGNVVGVLCADSTEEDVYSDVTVGFFGHFTKLISGLVASYTSKFDLQHAARTLDATNQFRTFMDESSGTEADVVEAMFETIVRQMEVSTLGVCSYDKDQKVWTVQQAQSVVEGYDEIVGQPLDLEQTLIGECITTGEVLTSTDPLKVRVNTNEYQMLGGQFLAIPMRSAKRTYGALYVENHQGTLSLQDFNLAEVLGDLAGQMIETVRSTTRLRTSALLDLQTGILNPDGVNRRLREEFTRATDQQSPLTMCLIRIDPSKSAAGDEDSRQLVFNDVLDRVRTQVREYDILGRYGEDILAVGLIAYSAQEAQFWVEGIRRDVASTAIDVAGKRTTATISVGVAESNPRDTWESLLDHAVTALETSVKQQNKVSVFS